MLSRVADSLYWINRYLERVENTARALIVNSELTLDLPTDVGHWAPLVDAMGDRSLFDSTYTEVTGENVVRFLTFDESNPNSILSAVHGARANAASVRDSLTNDMWEELNEFYLKLGEATTRGASREFFLSAVRFCQMFRGTADASMSHDEGWDFVRLGRMIERADQTSRLLDTRYLFSMKNEALEVGPYGDILGAALLRSTSALEMYRRRYHQIVPGHLVAFLVLDREFPRSIRYCVAAAEEAVRAVSATPDSSYQNRAEQVLGRLRAYLDYMHVDEIMAHGVHEFIDVLQMKLIEADQAVRDTFCSAPAEADLAVKAAIEA